MDHSQNISTATLVQQAQHHLQNGRTRQADQVLHQAVKVDPKHGLANAYLALTAWELKKLDDAETYAKRAMDVMPRCAEAHQALGLVAFNRLELTDCVAKLKKALEIQPDLIPARNYLSVALSRLGRHQESLEQCELVLTLHPANPHAHFNRATALLAQQRYQEGWIEYEWRFRTGQVARPAIPRPRWDGSPLNGRSILVHTEQGKGDVFQFIRLLPQLKEAGGRVVLACQKSLKRIVSRCKAIDEWFPIDEAAPVTFDVYTPLLSLPGLLNINQRNIPAEVPYVFPDPERVERWRSVIGKIDGFKIGICWQGSPTFIGDGIRSIRLQQFASLAELPEVKLISLQREDGIDQLERVRDQFGLITLDGLDESCGAFEDTAAVMQHLDLIVSSDTACLHLAGALGVETWAALSAGADWRWRRSGSDSPWYPTMRLFRQHTPGDWESVFREMGDAVMQRRSLGTTPVRVGSDTAIEPPVGPVHIEVSPGELIDRITILQIKRERITEADKRDNVQRELAVLTACREESVPESARRARWTASLHKVNEELWEIEDAIRECERVQDFGPRFIDLARSVYRKNDQRAAIKRQINEALGARMVDEKSYTEYEATSQSGH